MQLPNQSKQEANERVRQIERNVAAYDNTCMFVLDETDERCGKPAVKCHSIPRKSVLTRLRNADNYLLEFRWNINSWRDVFNQDGPVDLSSPKAFRPSKVGILEASTGYFACKEHDQKFRPIDVPELDISDNRTPILTAYRIALFVNEQWRKYIRFLGQEVEMRLRNSNNRHARIEWYKLKAKQPSITSMLNGNLEKLGEIWHKGETSYIDVEAHLVQFRSRLRFAATVIVGSVGLYATVFPRANDWHSMLLSHHRDHGQAEYEQIEELNNLAKASVSNDNYGVEMVAQLLSDGFGSVIASDRSYSDLTDGQREDLQELIRKSSQPELLNELFSSSRSPSSASTLSRAARRRGRMRR